VTLTAAGAEEEHAAATEPTSSTTSADEGEDDTGAPTWLAVLALVLGGLGLLAGVLGLARSRRPRVSA
jgi:hypothetical protein